MEILLNPAEHSFLPFRIRRHTMVNTGKSLYRVYRPGGEFITVEGHSALEAFRNSGYDKAERIVRVTKYLFTSIDRSQLNESSEFTEVQADGPIAIIPMDTPETEEGIKPETIVEAPQRVGATFLSAAGIENLLSATATVPAATGGELEGFEEILPVATPMPRPSEAKPGARPTTVAMESLPELPPAPPAEAKVLSPDEVKALLDNGNA